MRPGILALLAAVAVSVASGACGSDELTADEVVQRTYDAIDEPGTVYHVKAEDGTEVWMDTENEHYRRSEPSAEGGLTSIGDGWEKTTYDPINNVTATEDESPNDQLPPRVDNPAVQWLEPLTALAYARELELIGETTSVDGRRVIAVLGRSPVVQGDSATGEYLVGRVEVDAKTYDLVSFERRREPAPGATPEPDAETTRIIYEQPEHLNPDDLPDDFFDKSVVESQVATLEDNVEAIRDLGLDPYWLGETYEAHGVALTTSSDKGGAIADPELSEGSFHYNLRVPAGSAFQEFQESVVVKLGKPGVDFGPPEVEGFSGTTPEDSRETTARGVPATMYRSLLRPSDLPCPAEPCAPTDIPLFYRLVFTLGETVIQIETSARVDRADGVDLNVYNNDSGILELAEALFIAN